MIEVQRFYSIQFARRQKSAVQLLRKRVLEIGRVPVTSNIKASEQPNTLAFDRKPAASTTEDFHLWDRPQFSAKQCCYDRARHRRDTAFHPPGETEKYLSKKQLLELETKKLEAAQTDFSNQVAQDMTEVSLDMQINFGNLKSRQSLDVSGIKFKAPKDLRNYKFEYKSPEFTEKAERLHKQFKNHISYSELEDVVVETGLTTLQLSDQAYAQDQKEMGDTFMKVSETMADILVGLDPYTGFARDASEFISGKNIITGEELSTLERTISGIAFGASFVTFGAASSIKNAIRAGIKVADIASKSQTAGKIIKKFNLVEKDRLLRLADLTDEVPDLSDKQFDHIYKRLENEELVLGTEKYSKKDLTDIAKDADGPVKKGTFYVADSGTFTHNSGTVEIRYRSRYTNRTASALVTDGLAIHFYNLRVNVQGDFDLDAAGGDGYSLQMAAPIVVNNNLDLIDGTIFKVSSDTFDITIHGNLTTYCENLNDSICFEKIRWSRLLFKGGGKSVTFADPSQTLSYTSLTFDPGFGQTMTLGSNLTMGEANNSGERLVVSSGNLHLSTNADVTTTHLENNGAITCDSGGHIKYAGNLSGSPQGGDNSSCYSKE